MSHDVGRSGPHQRCAMSTSSYLERARRHAPPDATIMLDPHTSPGLHGPGGGNSGFVSSCMCRYPARLTSTLPLQDYLVAAVHCLLTLPDKVRHLTVLGLSGVSTRELHVGHVGEQRAAPALTAYLPDLPLPLHLLSAPSSAPAGWGQHSSSLHLLLACTLRVLLVSTAWLATHSHALVATFAPRTR